MPRATHLAGNLSHVVIIVKENHTFDNYFGTFPGADGIVLPRSPNPPPRDPDHRHSAWLTRKTTAIRQQFGEGDIPGYFEYARRFTLCDRYFTEVSGPSTPNHLMLVAADSPFIDNPRQGQAAQLKSSLPASLENRGLTWGNYGGYAFQYLAGINKNHNFTSDQFKVDASRGRLPSVSWVYAPTEYDEHPRDRAQQPSSTGNVTIGMQWTVDQVNTIVQGGLWNSTAIFITWDDWGGWYDHVDPPNVEGWSQPSPQPDYQGTQFRYGSRVGCLVLSPYAKSGYVSKQSHSHVSILKFCETLFGLDPLNSRDAAADGMMDCFDSNQQPQQPPSTSLHPKE